ncbi:RHS repeat domain-containing protein [Hamadaea tsunoensis]|uniref:RHS repeat domain-containing protein n=1 Tax=Hamadaea tsunoensis TaxID=53368 RepID=UPI0012F81C20|nr:RHS repeat-associated core domain-containing protein [Hamadaea tsunoensis]
MWYHRVRTRRGLLAGVTALAVTAAGLTALPAVPAAAAPPAGPTQHAQPVAVVAGHDAVPQAQARHEVTPFQAAAPRWPAAGTATVGWDSGVTAIAAADRSAAASRPARVRAGGLPVYLSRPAGTPSRGADAQQLTVTVADHATADRQGAALLVRLHRPTAANVNVAAASVAAVTVDFSGFAGAYGADWSQRLRLSQLPAGCLDATAPGCRPVPLATANDGRTATATVHVAAAQDTMVALTAGGSSGDGDYGATPLKASGTWSAGGNSGGFSWSYDLRTPPALGGPAPSVSLSYSSQAVDGQMAATNNQTTWIGEGFSYNPGEISRSYVGCADDMHTGANNSVKTGDQCWKTDNASLTLNGHSSELLYNASDGQWHMRTETGWRIKRFTGATNGDDNGEYWVVTTSEGTQYYFGLNRPTGYTGTAPANKTTNSVYTVPVYGNDSGEPCNKSTYATSSCAQAWQWNLDYVVDTHGNTESFWYTPQTNKYAANNGATTATYTRGGFLNHIDYGTTNRSGTDTDETSASAPMTVVFTPGDRCLSACSTHDATHWPDTPWDQSCTSGTCSFNSPTFWTDQRLASVKTRVMGSSGYRDVEQWTLHHTFPDPGDGTRAGLWLDSLSHTGLVGGSATVPDVKFVPKAMNNRVDTALTNGLRPMNWPRLIEIDSETGGKILVTYSDPECVAGTNMPSAPDTNTKLCYPVRWTPPDLGTEILDYFHKYVVKQVEQFDSTGSTPGAQSSITSYTYVGTPAWHYADDDGLTKAKFRTWSQWRGYSAVLTYTGTGTARTMAKSLYFRGMNGDKLSSGTRSASVADSKGLATLADDDQYAGLARESIVYNGPSGAAISGTVSDPWTSSATATRTLDGSTVQARFTSTQETHSWVALDHGRADRWTDTHTDFDAYAMPSAVTDNGDTAVTGDETCTLTDYARNTGAGILVSIKETRTYAMTCAAATAPGKVFTQADVVADERTSFDGQNWGSAPTKGDVTRKETLKDWQNNSGTFLTTATSGYDAYGRSVDVTDVNGDHTTTAYTPASGGPVTKTVSTSGATTWSTSTDFEPAWGVKVGVTDNNGRRTDTAYDPMGRLVSVWKPGHAKATYPTNPTTSYQYAMSATAPSVVTTNALGPNGNYLTSRTIYDALLRVRQTQRPEAGTGGGRIITDTFYDAAGRTYMTWGPYLAAGAPSTTMFVPADASDSISQWSRTLFDGSGRPVEADTNSKTTQLWHVSTAYTGDRTDVTPPAGGIASSTIKDAQGRTVELRQYHAGAAAGGTDPSTYDATTYTFNAKNQLSRLRNPGGSVWTKTYDLRGRLIAGTDPDAGSTSSTYDDAGRVTSTTDGRGVTLAFAYNDPLHRKTGEYLGTTTGTQLAGWAYDELANSRGLLTTSTRYAGGNAYVTAVTALDAAGRPSTNEIRIPAAETGLGGTYTYTTTYNTDGSTHTYRLPAIGGTGGLGAETLTHGYSDTGMPTTLTTTLGDTYVASTSYTSYGQLGTLTLTNNGGPAVQIGDYWDDATGRLSRIWTTRDTAPSTVSDLNFSYDDAGNPNKIVEVSPVAGTETQCFQTDGLDRLTQAWTPADGTCTAPVQSNIGASPAPYWTTWTIDSAGLRTRQVEHGTATGDRTTAYAYPAPTAAGAHELTSAATTDNTGTQTASFGYTDAAGKSNGATTSRPGPQGTQTLTWNSEGRLDTLTDSAGTVRYVYDVDGKQLVKRDPSGATLYLSGQEVRVDALGALVSATRFYAQGTQNIAQRTPSGLTWLIGDQQGTSAIAIGAGAPQTATVRHQTPYGAPRGGTVAWPNSHGYLGGAVDGTGLTTLGVREYDPVIGRFVSVDPVLETSDPSQLNGYVYTGSNPIRQSDPEGTTSRDFLDQNSPMNKAENRCDAACVETQQKNIRIAALLNTSMYGRPLTDREYSDYKKEFHYTGSKDFTLGDALNQWNCPASKCGVVDRYTHDCPKMDGITCPASSQGYFFQEICAKMGGNTQSCGAYRGDPAEALGGLANSPNPWVSVPTSLTQIVLSYGQTGHNGQGMMDGVGNLAGNLAPGAGRAAIAPLASFIGSGIGDPPGINLLRPGTTFLSGGKSGNSWAKDDGLYRRSPDDGWTEHTVLFPMPLSFAMLDVETSTFTADLQSIGMIS